MAYSMDIDSVWDLGMSWINTSSRISVVTTMMDG